MSLAQIQAEIGPWVRHNFGDRPAHQPLLGMVEEMSGEFDERSSKDDRIDALADCAIFMCDFARSVGVDMGELERLARDAQSFGASPRDADVFLGRVCHHYLKQEQKIKAHEDHPKGIRDNLLAALTCLFDMASYDEVDLAEATLATWVKVRTRDFKAFPMNGKTA
jgi:hypothetical protein